MNDGPVETLSRLIVLSLHHPPRVEGASTRPEMAVLRASSSTSLALTRLANVFIDGKACIRNLNRTVNRLEPDVESKFLLFCIDFMDAQV